MKHCVDKFANTNQLIMKTYVEVQGKINERRMEDYNRQIQQQQQQQENQALQTETNTEIVTQQDDKPT